jgi:hypothetical protein
MMSYNRLGDAVERFSIAIKHAMGSLPKESLIQYFATSSGINLEEILNISEQMEEYELCDIILQALKHRSKSSCYSISEPILEAQIN